MKAPKLKLQAPEKLQFSTSKSRRQPFEEAWALPQVEDRTFSGRGRYWVFGSLVFLCPSSVAGLVVPRNIERGAASIFGVATLLILRRVERLVVGAWCFLPRHG